MTEDEKNKIFNHANFITSYLSDNKLTIEEIEMIIAAVIKSVTLYFEEPEYKNVFRETIIKYINII